MKQLLWVLSAAFFLATAALSGAGEMDEEFRVKRKEVFEFSRAPSIKKEGDKTTISFACKDFCDVTVAVERDGGRILRHLASGVLGPNAPEPFQPNSLEQTVVWDGKDDQGRYVDDLTDVQVRVSLGLEGRFERHFLWSPHRRICNQGHAPTLYATAPFVAQPEGVYVFDGSQHDHLRLFDHDGNYVRTVYPFPHEKLEAIKGVKTQVFPQSGLALPLKGGNYRSTLLTSGTNYEGRDYLLQLFGMAAYAMAVQDGRIALLGNRLNRLAADGSTGELPLEGPKTRMEGPVPYGTVRPGYLPRSAAFSPDGKTLYVTGWSQESGNPNWYLTWIQGVGRIDFENGTKVDVFAGTLSPDAKHSGSEPGKFKGPVSVDVDSQGRVYVADRHNERIQIFDPSGKHLKSVPVPGGEVSLPSEVAVDRRNGDIYVFLVVLGLRPVPQERDASSSGEAVPLRSLRQYRSQGGIPSADPRPVHSRALRRRRMAGPGVPGGDRSMGAGRPAHMAGYGSVDARKRKVALTRIAHQS